MKKTTERKSNYQFETEGKEFVKAKDLYNEDFPIALRVEGIYYSSGGYYGGHWVAVLEELQLSLSQSLNDTMTALDEDKEWVSSVNRGVATVTIKKKKSKKYGEYYLPVFEYEGEC